jgi:hypothetical protein
VSRFAVELASADEAGAFWKDSPNATVFTAPAVLSRFCPRVDWWLARKGGEPMCLWPVCRLDEVTVGVPEFCYHVGPLLSAAALGLPAHSWLAETTGIFEGLIAALLDRYGGLHAQLPCGLHDVRAFDWWNYHRHGEPRFAIRPRYTARICGIREIEDEVLQAGFRSLRRRELRRVARDGAPTRVADWNFDEIAGLYSEVMQLQGLSPAPSTIEKIGCLVALVKEGHGQVVAFRDASSRDLASAVLLLEAKGVANMVLNLTASRCRDSGIPAWSVYHAIKSAQAGGCDIFDFNGANSPNRGDDKHSYGSVPELFFDIRYPG